VATNIEYAVKYLIQQDATLLGLVSTRIYPNPLPENPTYPSIGYQQISDVNHSSHSGSSQLATTRLQLDVWHNTYDAAKTVRDNLKRVLRDYKGTVINGTYTDRIDRIIWDNDQVMFDTETRKYHRVIDLLIWHNTQY